MTKTLLRLSACLLFIASSVVPLLAAKVSGSVKAGDGAPVAHALVVYTNNSNGRAYKFSTDKNGAYSGLGVAPGTYNVNVTDPTGAPIGTRSNIVIKNDSDTLILNFGGK